MDIEIRNIMCDIEVAKERLEDLATAHGWFVDHVFTKNDLETMEEVKRYGYGYNEHRIQNNQILDLMLMYLRDLHIYIGRFNKLVEQEKSATVQSANSTDNA
ncbi:DUF1474 family protein [Staphylococcus saprophyticus]|uniref:type II toxin-antitoxin system toxin TscT n=1 Tax=Staphylococcus saprophyticus TaxID=29385 RepID=UPI0034DD8D28